MQTDNITPAPKPGQTRSERRQKRPAVMRYRAFCNAVRPAGITLPDADRHVTFVLPMPAPWSGKKRAQMDGKPHQQRPDRDNLEKALPDAFFSEDCGIRDGHTTKVRGKTGQIIITTTGEVAR